MEMRRDLAPSASPRCRQAQAAKPMFLLTTVRGRLVRPAPAVGSLLHETKALQPRSNPPTFQDALSRELERCPRGRMRLPPERLATPFPDDSFRDARRGPFTVGPKSDVRTRQAALSREFTPPRMPAGTYPRGPSGKRTPCLVRPPRTPLHWPREASISPPPRRRAYAYRRSPRAPVRWRRRAWRRRNCRAACARSCRPPRTG